MIKKDIFKLKNRKKIYNFIIEHPGVHFRKICKEINTSEGTIRYHLNFLEKSGIIDIKLDGGYKRYYLKDEVGKLSKELINILRQEIPRRIILLIYCQGAVNEKDLCINLEKHPATIDYHLKKMLKLGIIKEAESKEGMILRHEDYFQTEEHIQKLIKHKIIKEKQCVSKVKTKVEHKLIGREKFYRFENPKIVYALLKYQNSLCNNIEKDILYFINNVTSGEYVYKAKRPNKYIDEIIDSIYEVFPHPYHI